MNIAPHQQADQAKMLSEVITKGNLAMLSEQEKVMYYTKVCESVGLNPLTKPFEYITLNGKLTLYALRSCTDQLRSIHKVSVEELTETEREGVFIVTAKVRNGDGRTDVAKGAVSITGLKGEPLANALMKAETKAKRRATLSICGLGMLDETEVETIPGATSMPDIKPYSIDENKPKSIFKTNALRIQYQRNVESSLDRGITVPQVNEIINLEKEKLAVLRASGDERDQMVVDSIQNKYRAALIRLKHPDPEAETPTFDEEEIPPYVRDQMEQEKEFLQAKGMNF